MRTFRSKMLSSAIWAWLVFVQIALAATMSGALAAYGATKAALSVGPDTHVVVLEYEAWFGPHAVTFQDAEALPMLRSADMDKVGGGYDSRDPAIVRRYVAWIERMGADAITLDLTNNISCIFNSAWFVRKYLEHFNDCPIYRHDYRQIRDNAGNLYPAWTLLNTRLKIIPLLGAIDRNAFIPDLDGKTAFEKEVNYFTALVTAYPKLSVIYRGKPLLLIYLGAPVDPGNWPEQFHEVRDFLNRHSQIAAHATLRLMSGFLESQPRYWAAPGTPAGPIDIDPAYGFWSLVDRLKPAYGDYPTYNRQGTSVENMTASIATPGQNGWGCPEPHLCPDDALRYGLDRSYVTLERFMRYARELRPIFLFISQFNEFDKGNGDEGWSADTSDDIEPSHRWHDSAVDAVRTQIDLYRRSVAK